MIIKNILTALNSSTRPVARVIKSNNYFKTIVIGLNAGMVWPDHKAPLPTTIIVTEGSVIYKEQNREMILYKHDNFEIPVNIIHSLEAQENSICILLQGDQ